MAKAGVGRPSKPTALKLVQGTRKSRVNQNEPMPVDPGTMRPPAGIGSEALAVWDAHAPDLIRQKVLTAWDVEAFAIWANAVATAARARAHLDDEGEIVAADVFDRNGKPSGTRLVVNPWFSIWRSSVDVVQRYGARFGMTPSDRAALSVGEPKQRAAKARLLTQGDA